MVTPIRELVNKYFLTTKISFTITSHYQASTLPTVFPSRSIEMDFLAGSSPDNFDKIRGKSLSTNKNISRDSSMSSTKSSVMYYKRIANNNVIDINDKKVDNSLALFYETDLKKALHISKVAEY